MLKIRRGCIADSHEVHGEFSRCGIGLGPSFLILLLMIAAAATTQAGSPPPAGQTSPNVDSLLGANRIQQLMSWGERVLADEHFSEAEARFRDVLGIDWNNPKAYRLLQETREARVRALRDWERAGRSAEQRGDVMLAVQYYQKILAEDSSRTSLSGAILRLERRDQADRLIQQGLEKYIADDFVGAQSDFEKALAVCPADSMAAVYRERALQKATGVSSMVDLRADTLMWTKYSEALKLLRSGDLGGAERLWNEVLARYPGNEAIRSNLEQIARRRKQEFSNEEIAP